MTREGGIGILQIVGFTEDPKGVKIRYKMVQAAASWQGAPAAGGLRAREASSTGRARTPLSSSPAGVYGLKVGNWEGFYGTRNGRVVFLVITDGTARGSGVSNTIIIGPRWSGAVRPRRAGSQAIPCGADLSAMTIGEGKYSLAEGRAFVVLTSGEAPAVKQLAVQLDDCSTKEDVEDFVATSQELRQLSQPGDAPAFGPAVEQTVEDRQFVDLDSGRALEKTQDGPGPDMGPIHRRAKEISADVLFFLGGAKAYPFQMPPGTVVRGGLVCEMAIAPLQSEAWSELSAGKLTEMAPTLGPPTGSDRPLREPPETMAIRTREGGTGILQIVGFTEDPKGVKIRYKMVQGAPAVEGRQAVAREAQAWVELSGRVIDEETREPVENYALQLGWPTAEGSADITWTGNIGYSTGRTDGRFSERHGMAAGKVLAVRVLADGYLPQPVTPEPVTAPATRDGLEVVLKHGREVNGRVLDHRGEPVAGAHVYLGGNQTVELSDGEPQYFAGSWTVTDADGRFTVRGAGDGLSAVVVSAQCLHAWIARTADPGKELTVRLPAPAVAVARYEIEGDKPEAVIRLELKTWEMEDWKGIAGSAQTLRVPNKGEAALNNLTPGVYDVTRMKELRLGGMGRGVFCDRCTVTLQTGTTTPIEFVRKRGHPVTGEVLGPADMGVPGAFLYVKLGDATGDLTGSKGWKLPTFDALTCEAPGRFTTARLLPGTYTIVAEAYKPAPPPDAAGVGGMTKWGLQQADFVGTVKVTVPEEGQSEPVQIVLTPAAPRQAQGPRNAAAADGLARAAALPAEPEARVSPASLENVLTSQSRWDVIRGLEAWDRDLTEQERQRLKGFAQDNEGRDWLLQYRAHAVLRKHGGETRTVAPEIVQAEAILAQVNPGKLPQGFYGARAADIVGLGNATVPLLLELLAYNGQSDQDRKQAAIQALARLHDDRIVPALKAAVGSENNRNQLEQELLALLCHDAGDAMADYVASVVSNQKNDFDQERTVSFLSGADLPRKTKMRLFSHYNESRSYGKHAVIRGLQALDDAESFAQLCQILRTRDEPFQVTAYALGQLKNSDPCPILLEELPKTSDAGVPILIQVLGERRYVPAIGELQTRRDKASDSPYGRTARLLAAAALCRLDAEYDRNAAIVREGLQDDQLRLSALTVAGWLRDEETVKVLVPLVDKSDVGRSAIEALGQIGSKSAAAALMEAVQKLPTAQFGAIGGALLAIGRKNNDQALMDYGKGVSDVAVAWPWISQVHQLVGAWDAHRAEVDRAAAWLATHPEVTTKLLKEDPDATGEWGAMPYFLDKAWNPQLVPTVEEMIRTNGSKVSFHTAHGTVPHYHMRSGLAEFLTKKTGKEYTYVDADGTVRKGGENP
jgi:hypothetical protein